MWRVLPAAALTACLGSAGLGGNEQFPKNNADSAPSEPPTSTDEATVPCPVTGFTSTCEATTAVSELEAIGGEGMIDIVHTGVVLPDCGDWDAQATPDPQTNTIVVDYVDLGSDTCSDDCGWTFEYTLEVEPGTWTLDVAGDEAEVVVD